ncbi:MAG: hypothetical protein IT303_16715 [Dehalococcoidia bacterium]|nr:hypothetical protein [Dehalococcoidia bacterium]
MHFRGGRLSLFAHDPAARTVAFRIDGGAFNLGDAPDGWGRGDFTLLFAATSGFDGGTPSGAVQALEEAPEPGGGVTVRLETATGTVRWTSSPAHITWFVPRSGDS